MIKDDTPFQFTEVSPGVLVGIRESAVGETESGRSMRALDCVGLINDTVVLTGVISKVGGIGLCIGQPDNKGYVNNNINNIAGLMMYFNDFYQYYVEKQLYKKTLVEWAAGEQMQANMSGPSFNKPEFVSPLTPPEPPKQ